MRGERWKARRNSKEQQSAQTDRLHILAFITSLELQFPGHSQQKGLVVVKLASPTNQRQSQEEQNGCDSSDLSVLARSVERRLRIDARLPGTTKAWVGGIHCRRLVPEP